MKKLTILLSVLFVAFTSVFAQETASVTLNPNKAWAFGEQFFYEGVSSFSINAQMDASITLVGVEKGDLEVEVKEDDTFHARISADASKVTVRYTITEPIDSLYKDTIIVYKDGSPEIADSLFVSVKVTKKAKMPIIVDESVFAFGEQKLDAAENGITRESTITLAEPREVTFEKSGADKDLFEVKIENGKLVVTFKAEETGDYSAKVTLKAQDAEDKEVNLSAKVTMPDPTLSVTPDKWAETVMIKGGNADAKKNFSVFGTYLVGSVKAEMKDGTNFTWNDTEKAVAFHATETGIYKDTLVVTSRKAETVKVPMEVTVTRPVINAVDALDFGHISLVDAVSGTQKKETSVSVTPEEEMTLVMGGANASAFAAELKDGKLSVKFQTNAVGTYNATATIKAADALDKVINLTAIVDMPASDLQVLPSQWKETVKLENGSAKAERQISINAVFTFSVPQVTLKKGNAGFTWDATNSKVTFAATKEGTYQDTLIVSAIGSTGEIIKKIALEIKVEKGGDTPTPEPVPVTGVTLNKTAAELAIGGTVKLTATVAPANADNKNVAWTTSDPAIATVSATGLVSALAKGSATITVTTEDGGKTATCAITVKEEVVPPTPGGCDNYAYTFVKGDEDKFKAQATNEFGAYTWTMEPATLDYIGFDTQYGKGVQFGSGSKPALAVSFTTANVADCSIKNIVINAAIGSSGDGKLAVFIGDQQIGDTATLERDAADYTFENTAAAKGNLRISLTNTVKAMYIASIAVNMGDVTPVEPVAVTGVTLDKETASIEAGKSVTLTATVAPADATNKKVTWSSSDEAVATVADGVVMGKAEGTATITVKTDDGNFEAKCVVTVTKSSTPIVAVTGVKLDKTSYEIMEGLPVTLVATVEPADATNKDVTWSTSDATVATVENGVVTTLKEGKVTITVKTVDGGFTASCVITVNRDSPPLPGSVTFTKVTADQEDWSGQYILVYEQSATAALVWNGKDAGKGEGCFSAAVADGKITLEDYAKYCIYIDKMSGGYSLKIGDNYMGGKEDANGITFAATPILNKIKQYSADSLEIVSNNTYMRFNKGAQDMRFRYFKAATYFRQQGVALYKADQEITPQPAWVPDTISVAEAIAVMAEEKTHYVKGIVGEITSTADDISKYHNIDFMLADMDDASKQLKCFRLWWQKLNGEFNGGEIATGDTILVYGQTSIYTDSKGNKIDEIINGYVVEVIGKGDGTGPVGPTPQGQPLDIDYAEAAYILDAEGSYWMIYAGKYPADETQMYLDYPQLVLFVNNADNKHLAGTYEVYGGSTLYTSDNDSIEFISGTVIITCTEAGNELYPPYYHFVVTLIDAQGNEYVYEFDTEVWAYDYATDEDITLEDKPTQGIENTVVFEFDPNAPIYNIQGMQVDRNTRGILIQNGHKFMINGL